MKKLILYCCYILLSTKLFSQIQTPSLLWEYSHNVDVKQVANDNFGNFYLCGSFAGTKDLDITSATTIASSTDNGFGTPTADAYLAKYGASGNLVWKIILSSNTDDFYHNVTVDVSGNIYVFGTTTNTTNINPLGSTYNLTTNGNFIAKYSTNGQLIWAFQTDISVPGESFAINHAEFITLDQTNQQLLVAGFFDGTVDVDPAIGTTYLLYDTTTTLNRKTFAIVKYDLNGNFVSAADFEGANDRAPIGSNMFEFSRIKTDGIGNIWILGQIYQYTVDIDPSTTVNNVVGTGGLNTGCIAKFDANYQFQFANVLTGSRFATLNFDSQNNLLLAGDFGGTPDFDFGAGNTYLSAGPSTPDFFVAKYNQNMGFISAFTHGNTPTTFSGIYSIFADVNDNVIVQGLYDLSSNVSDFDPSVAGTYTVTGFGSFIAKYSPNDSLLAIGTINSLNGYENYMQYNSITNKMDFFGEYGANQTIDFDMESNGTYIENQPTNMNFVVRYNLNCEIGNVDTIYQTICYDDTLVIGTQTFNTSGVYPLIYNSVGGCDSIVSLNLNVIPHHVIINETICSTQSYNFNGNILNTSGVYTDTLLNILACDSIITLNLTVVPLNDNVTLSNYVLSSAETFINYQWYNCTTSSIINGATAKDFSVNSSADYAAILTKQGCTDTTNCIQVTFNESSSTLPSNIWGNQLSTLNVKAFTVDKNGNSYLVGYQLPLIDLDPGPTTVTPPNVINGLYILKYNPLGNLLWAKWIEPMPGESGTFDVKNVNTDTSGAVIISGGFVGIFDVDASGVVNDVYSNANSSPNSDMFMLKYNSDGTFAWFNSFGEGTKNYFTDTYIDENNYIHCVGYVQDNIDFNPGAGVNYLDTYYGFIAKYNSNGNYVDGIGMDDNVTVNQICLDNGGNIFVSGDYNSTRDIAPGVNNDLYIGDPYMGVSSSYVTKLDANYNPIVGMGIISDNTIKIIDMLADNNGKLNIVGTYNTANNNFNYNGTTTSLTPYGGGGDCFLAQYNTNLELNWMRRVANSFADAPKQIVLDSINNMFILGGYKMDLDVDGTAGTLNLTGEFSTTDTYLASYNENGYFNWGIKVGSSSNDDAVGIAIDNNANIYTCINASNTIIYSREVASQNQLFTTTTGPGAYYARYGNCNFLNNSISDNGNFLSAIEQYANYQWYDCNNSQIIIGETNKDFYPTVSGNYSVLLSNGNCNLTSNCVSFNLTTIDEHKNIINDYEIFPNPTSQNFTIEFKSSNEKTNRTITLYNSLGKIVKVFKMENDKMEINIAHLASGIYWVELSSKNGTIVKKVVINN